MRFFVFLLLSFLSSLALASKPANSDDFYESLVAVMYSAKQQHILAAAAFSKIGHRLEAPELLKEATVEAVLANDINLAIRYSSDWIRLGGGIPARQSHAELLLLSERWADAEQALKTLMQGKAQTPKNLFTQLSSVKNSEKGLEIAIRLFADDAVSKEYLSQLAVKANNWEVAERAAADSLAKNKTRVRLYFIRAHLNAVKNNEYKSALQILENYMKDGCPGSIAAACSEEILLFAYQRFVKTLSGQDHNNKWQEPLKEPEKWRDESLLAAAEFYEFNQFPAKAKPLYARVADKFFHARLGLARLARNDGDLAEALRILNESKIANEKEFVLREVTASEIMGKMGNTEAALQRISDARKTAPDNSQMLYFQGLQLETAGYTKDAIALFRRITELYPQDPDGWNALGYTMADHNISLKEAEAYIKRALLLRKDDPNILDSLGWVNYRLGRLASARLYLTRAAENATSAEIFAHLGEVLWELGEHNQAKQVWQQALRQFPENSILNETTQRYHAFE